MTCQNFEQFTTDELITLARYSKVEAAKLQALAAKCQKEVKLRKRKIKTDLSCEA